MRLLKLDQQRWDQRSPTFSNNIAMKMEPGLACLQSQIVVQRNESTRVSIQIINRGFGSPSNIVIGICESRHRFKSSSPHQTLYGYGYAENGNKIHNCNSYPYAEGFSQGDIINILVDLKADQISFGLNSNNPKLAFKIRHTEHILYITSASVGDAFKIQ